MNKLRLKILKSRYCTNIVDMVTFTEEILKDTHMEKAPSKKTSSLTKSINMGILVVGASNKLFIRRSQTETKLLKK